MSSTTEYENVGKMTFVPKGYVDRGEGWFYRMAGLRLTEAPEPYETYKRTISEFAGYHLFDKVHVIMLIEERIIPKEIGLQILKTFRMMEREGLDKARSEAGGLAHSGEAYLIQRLGWHVGGWLHEGRSSHDLAITQNRVMQRGALLDVMHGVNNLRETLLDLSEQHLDTVMPYYTALQHARPMTLGFFLTSFVKMLERDSERLELCYRHTNVSPMGSAEGTGSDFPLNPGTTAELAGFDDVFDNACDVWESYDIRAEAFAALGTVNDIVARIAGHLYLWCSEEFRMAELADRYCHTSSIMSQKKNPGGVEALQRTAAAAKNLVLMDEGSRLTAGGGNDHYFDEAVRLTMNNIMYLRGILRTTTFKKKRMRELCDYGFICNSDLCRILVQKNGLPWRTAHQIMAVMTRLAKSEGMEMADVTPEFLDRAAMECIYYGKPLGLNMETIREAFDPDRSVRSLNSHGSTAKDRVKEQIARSRDRLRRDRMNVGSKRERLTAAADKMEKKIDGLIGL